MYAIFIVLVLYLVVPAIGLSLFLKYRKVMISSSIERPPIIHFFFIFAYYGSFAVMLLNGLFWKASGLSSIGLGLSFLTAPFAMGLIVYDLRKKRQLSAYHTLAYKWAFWYFPALAILIAMSFVIRVWPF